MLSWILTCILYFTVFYDCFVQHFVQCKLNLNVLYKYNLLTYLQCGRHYGVKCRTIIHEQHPHIGVLIFQVGESSVQGEGNSIVCGTVTANANGSMQIVVGPVKQAAQSRCVL